MIQIRSIKSQVDDRLGKSQDARLKTTGDTLKKNLSAVEEEIYQVRNQSGQDPLNFPIKLNNRLASLFSVVTTGRRPAHRQRGADLQEPHRRAQSPDRSAREGRLNGSRGVQHGGEAAGADSGI